MRIILREVRIILSANTVLLDCTCEMVDGIEEYMAPQFLFGEPKFASQNAESPPNGVVGLGTQTPQNCQAILLHAAEKPH